MFWASVELITIWAFYFFASILVFLTWAAQLSFTLTSMIVELSLLPLAMRKMLDFT